jgi:hypothetical protein
MYPGRGIEFKRINPPPPPSDHDLLCFCAGSPQPRRISAIARDQTGQRICRTRWRYSKNDAPRSAQHLTSSISGSHQPVGHPAAANLRIPRITLYLWWSFFGAQLGWLVDPNERTLLVFQPGQQPLVLEDPADQLPLLPDFEAPLLQLTLGELFSWL